MSKGQYRPDREGPARRQFESNKRKIIASQDICGICGRPVDKTLRFPDPWSAVVDHIIPVTKGGNPSDISNLQLAHNCCNRQKADKTYADKSKAIKGQQERVVAGNEDLPLSADWLNF